MGAAALMPLRSKIVKELEMYCEIVGDYIIQSFVDGIEYTVDIFVILMENQFISHQEKITSSSW